jgi:hypothetical protein
MIGISHGASAIALNNGIVKKVRQVELWETAARFNMHLNRDAVARLSDA